MPEIKEAKVHELIFLFFRLRPGFNYNQGRYIRLLNVLAIM